LGGGIIRTKKEKKNTFHAFKSPEKGRESTCQRKWGTKDSKFALGVKAQLFARGKSPSLLSPGRQKVPNLNSTRKQRGQGTARKQEFCQKKDGKAGLGRADLERPGKKKRSKKRGTSPTSQLLGEALS